MNNTYQDVSIVVQIEGVPYTFSTRDITEPLRYGDPVAYGEEGLFYGGSTIATDSHTIYVDKYYGESYTYGDGSLYGEKIPVEIPASDALSSTQNIISLDNSSLSITQRLEIEQGKNSVSLMTLGFVDKDGIMSRVVSPGIVIPDILGAGVDIYLGYGEIEFPDDYLKVFRGYVCGVTAPPGLVILQLADPTIKKRQSIAYIATTVLTSNILSGATTIPVQSTADFFQNVGVSPSVADPGYRCYIQIDDEWIECSPPNPTNFTVYQRGARGTTAAAHLAGATVTAGIQIGATYGGVNAYGKANNPQNAITIALCTMLSGWAGPFVTGVLPLSFGAPIIQPSTPVNYVTLIGGVDAVSTYGLTIGDTMTFTQSATLYNSTITGFLPYGGTLNNIIVFSVVGSLPVTEFPGTTPLSFRSQYDLYPPQFGLKMVPKDVNIAQHLFVQNTFIGSAGYDLLFFITSEITSGKDWLESQVYYPVGAYALAVRGQASCGYHNPPLGSQGLITLSASNVIDPTSIETRRSVNADRAFFNVISYDYDFDEVNNIYGSTQTYDNATSLGTIGIANTLPISSQGMYTHAPSAITNTIISNISTRYLSRYAEAGQIIQLSVNYGVASVISPGDVVAIQDNGGLQILNFATGERDLGTQLFEVINWTLDIVSGKADLLLLGNVGGNVNDRYGSISPSSVLGNGSTSTTLILVDSYGAIFPGEENEKWREFIGLPVNVHTSDWVTQATGTIVSAPQSSPHTLQVTSLGITPTSGYIVDIPPYSASTNPAVDALFKLYFDSLDLTDSVVSGVSNTVFTVPSTNGSLYVSGNTIRVHNYGFTLDSGEITIAGVTAGGTYRIQTSTSMGFTPASGTLVDLLGFADGGGAWRFI